MGNIKSHHVILHRFVISGLFFQFIDIIRIRQKTHIKYQIGIRRNSVLESKREYRHNQAFKLSAFHKNLFQLHIKLSCEQFAGIDDIVCMTLQKRKFLTLLCDPAVHATAACQRMGPSRFFITLHQHFISCIQKQDLVFLTGCRHAFQHIFQFSKCLAASYVHAKCHPLDLTSRCVRHLRKFGNQRDRQVVHAEISHIFQSV